MIVYRDHYTGHPLLIKDACIEAIVQSDGNQISLQQSRWVSYKILFHMRHLAHTTCLVDLNKNRIIIMYLPLVASSTSLSTSWTRSTTNSLKLLLKLKMKSIKTTFIFQRVLAFTVCFAPGKSWRQFNFNFGILLTSSAFLTHVLKDAIAHWRCDTPPSHFTLFIAIISILLRLWSLPQASGQ